jgi:hypothetical protein
MSRLVASPLGRQTIAVVVLSACCAAPAALAQGTPPSPLDITTYGVVVQEPAMSSVKVRRGLTAGDVPFELTTPHGPESGERFPAVVFVNGVGADFRTWKIYTDWARLVAARGMAGIVYQGSATDPAASLSTLVAHLTEHGREIGVDSTRIALWACSANVTTALPYLMGSAPTGVRGAVLYYGATEVSSIRHDLPVFYLLAERDGPQLIAGIRALWASAAQGGAPWTMVVGTGMPHAFDALVETQAARDLVERTLGFLRQTLAPRVTGDPRPSAARRALTASYGVDWPAAAEAYAELARERPDDPLALRGLGQALLRSGRGGDAVEPLRRAIGLEPERWDLHDMLGGALLVRGENAAAVAELEKALASGPPPFRRIAILYNLACAHARLGQLDRAFARLQESLAAGFSDRQLLDTDPDLSPLRADPRWPGILH